MIIMLGGNTFLLQAEPDFDLDIKDDVQDECSKFGTVKHISVDKLVARNNIVFSSSFYCYFCCLHFVHLKSFWLSYLVQARPPMVFSICLCCTLTFFTLNNMSS